MMAMYWAFVILTLAVVGHQSQADSKTPRKPRQTESDRPNIIMILADDMGYGDIASYGHPTQEYGPVDVMAENGLRFTQAYSSDSVCSPSRAALLTGRLPVRLGVWGETHRVFLPWLTTGLPRSETTIAEALKIQNYTTGMVGKWHLGINQNTKTDGFHLPTNHGFDFVGHIIPFGGSYSCDNTGRYDNTPDPTKCFLYYRDEIVQQPYYQENLTTLFVNDTVDFIRRNKDGPFFYYFAMMHPHAPLFSSAQFKGSSARGAYGDNINELSWAVGTIIKELEELEIAKETLVVFMSDHGPHLEYCLDAGDPGIFRGFKSNSFEGGYRVPLISYWPGVITPGVSNEIFSALDLFSIFVDLADGEMPTDVEHDGVNDVSVLLGKEPSTRDFIFFYNRDILFAVRSGKYKLHFFTQADKTPEEFADVCLPAGYPSGHYFDCNKKSVSEECVTEHDPPLIFDLDADPTESWPLDPSKFDALIESVQNLISDHEAGLIRAPPLMDTENRDMIPCCNETTNCYCNYP
ncbi:arylsulfatase-like [Apostichopus japonicus]|uniref:arylsulfatase-like n=1 Tax=Stichopus japonicus TaxID=307972 RepID=UPI003AB54C7C